jgi:hypothetical protein
MGQVRFAPQPVVVVVVVVVVGFVVGFVVVVYAIHTITYPLFTSLRAPHKLRVMEVSKATPSHKHEVHHRGGV